MTILIDHACSIVKVDYLYSVDKNRQSTQTIDMRTLSERMRWVIAHRRDVIGNASNWARMAELDRRTVSAAIKRDTTMQGDNLAKLANAAKVSVAWLVSGDGDPEQADVIPEGPDPYASRAIATSRARALGASEGAIRDVRMMRGETYRYMSSPAWAELIWALSTNEMRRDPKEAQEIIRRFLEMQNEPPQPSAPNEKTQKAG